MTFSYPAIIAKTNNPTTVYFFCTTSPRKRPLVLRGSSAESGLNRMWVNLLSAEVGHSDFNHFFALCRRKSLQIQ